MFQRCVRITQRTHFNPFKLMHSLIHIQLSEYLDKCPAAAAVLEGQLLDQSVDVSPPECLCDCAEQM